MQGALVLCLLLSPPLHPAFASLLPGSVVCSALGIHSSNQNVPLHLTHKNATCYMWVYIHMLTLPPSVPWVPC